ncbi:MAG: hypothetical protein LAP38_18335 [Acidobacteriia bacterium]|nr:hypothetical protein [Terriglobia bacterium]
MKSLKRASLLIGVLMLLAATTFAAGVDGKWVGDVSTPDGSAISLTLSFKVDGDKVTGTVTGPTGDIEITDGKMTGETLEFVLNVDAGGTPLVFKCSGTLKGDDQLSIKMNGGAEMNLEFTAKRST